MVHFSEQIYLYMAAIIPFLYLSIRLLERKKKKNLNQILGLRMATILTQSLSESKRLWKLRLLSLSMLFCLIALARPQVGVGEQEVKTKGIELIFAVDVSRSMLAEDVKPSRLAQTKRDLSLLLDKLAGDKVGLIVFAGSSVLVSPLTSDYSALKMFIDGLTPDSVSTQGTKFEAPIVDALQSFKRGGVESDENLVVSKVLLIASDGEDNEPGALDAAAKALTAGMRIFTLGFGTEKGGSIPIRDEFGNLKGYRKDNSGNIIVTQTKSQLLSNISEAGGGKYYHAVVGGNHVNDLYRDFNNLDKAEFETTMAKDYNEYFQWPLSIALIFLCLELIMSEKKSRKSQWLGRFHGESNR